MKHNQVVVNRIACFALATVLLAAGLFWLGGLQGSVGGLFALGVGGLALFAGITGIGVSTSLVVPTLELEKKRSWNKGLLPERSTRLAGSYKEHSN